MAEVTLAGTILTLINTSALAASCEIIIIFARRGAK